MHHHGAYNVFVSETILKLFSSKTFWQTRSTQIRVCKTQDSQPIRRHSATDLRWTGFRPWVRKCYTVTGLSKYTCNNNKKEMESYLLKRINFPPFAQVYRRNIWAAIVFGGFGRRADLFPSALPLWPVLILTSPLNNDITHE